MGSFSCPLSSTDAIWVRRENPLFAVPFCFVGVYAMRQQPIPDGLARCRALSGELVRERVVVRGDIAWTVVRLDSKHVRVTLIDPSYTDPDDREAEIVLQHIEGIESRDILSNERLAIKNGSVKLTVPAGLLRIVDVTHR